MRIELEDQEPFARMLPCTIEAISRTLEECGDRRWSSTARVAVGLE